MRGKRAKQIRRFVYGDYSIRAKKYFRDAKIGGVVRDEKRRKYQAIKKDLKNWLHVLKEV